MISMTARTVLYSLTLTAVFALQVQTAAHAHAAGSRSSGIFVCTDDQGRVISSDQPISDCARRSMRELNRDGSLRRVVPPPQTRQQEKEAARQALLQQERERIQRAQQAHDRHLLLTYQDENDLRKRQKQAIALIDEEIDAAQRRVMVLNENLQVERERAKEWQAQQENPKARLPFAQQQRMSSIANAILAEDALIKERQTERERVDKDYDMKAKRLNELLNAAPQTAAADKR
ncbi:MAG: hypothetical protein Q4D19_12480 [Lautropia sp.]|nr:hypothetical protein [Lautropia sp.]